MQAGRSSTDAPSAVRLPCLSVPPLPVPLTPFFGRATEIAELRSLLEGGSRVLTLTGLGGTGKTRLALEVARAVQRMEQGWTGVTFVSLVNLTDPDLLLPAIRSALSLPAVDDTEPLEQIANSLAGQRLLLVLDNFEQLPDPAAATIGRLLERAPGLACLVTSRRALGLTGEQDCPVAPLPVPAERPAKADASALSTLLGYPSVQLFLSGAQRARPDFQVTAANAVAVAQLCQTLEGIPLALELAAARSAAVTPAQMLEHLSDRFGFLVARHRHVPERHRTLWAALQWSYQSLPESHRRLLARLSVFRGGWTLEAAEAVCEDFGFGILDFGLGPTKTSDRSETPPLAAALTHPPQPLPAIQNPKSKIQNLLDALLALRDASLVIAEQTGETIRFRMLETVREYAAERLAEQGETEAVQARHRGLFLALAERAEPELEGPDQAAWLARLDTEHDNLRTALAGCDGSGGEAGLRLTGALWRFWEVRGHLSEGRAQLAAALGREGADGSTLARAKALHGAGVLAYHQGDLDAAQALHEASLAIRQELGDQQGIAASLHALGFIAHKHNDYRVAMERYEASLAIRRELRDQQGIAASLAHQGNVARDQSDYAAARALHQESLAISQALADQGGTAHSLHDLGILAYEQGDFAEARRLYEESLAIQRELGDRLGIAASLHDLGNVVSRQSDFPTARALYKESLALRRELGDKWGSAYTLHSLGIIAEYEGDYPLAASLYQQSLPVWKELGDTNQYAWTLHGLGYLALRQGDLAAARALFDESLQIFRATEHQVGLARSLERYAELAVAEGRLEQAARLTAAAASLREAIGAPLPPNERKECDETLVEAREALGEDDFARAWEAGRKLTGDEAIRCALGLDSEPVPVAVGWPDDSSPPLIVPPLPVPPTPFFGRETEITQVRARLVGGCRLLTLTGLGGTGKTRLALEVARAIQETDRVVGVGFVPLADLTDPRLLLRTIQGALKLPTTGATDPLEEIASYLGDRPFVFVLDNFEQLLDEGTETVRALLERSPGLKCLVTSRVALGLQEEVEYPVAPLPTPAAAAQPERLLENACALLFQSRAQAVWPEFQVTAANAGAVAQLCRALDGIPLALELAAGRAAVVAPAQMVELLSDRFGFLAGRQPSVAERHRTLRAVLEWSVQSLPEEQQRLLARLSVFRGGWTLEAAAAVCGSRIQATLDALSDLREASLVIPEDAGETMRFRMLETVREYAAERLAELGETEAVQARHRELFLALAERAEPELEGPDQVAWLKRLEGEHDNLRAALANCLAAEKGAVDGLRLAGALRRFWEVRNYFSEGRASLAEMLARLEAAAPTAARAKALTATGVLAWRQGDLAAARPQHEEGLALWRQLDDERGIAYSLYYLARVIPGLPDSQTEAALEIFRRVGDKLGMAHALNWLGELALESGDAQRARRLYEEILQLKREVGDRWEVAHSVHNLGMAAYVRGDYTEARQLFEESLANSREFGDPRGAAWSLHELGNVVAREGEGGRARELYQEGLTLFRGWGDNRGIAWSLHRLTLVAIRQGEYATARTMLAQVQRLWRAEEYPRGIARSLLQEGLLAYFQGDYRVAQGRFEEGLALFREHADPRGIELALRHVGMVAARQGEYGLARQALEESLAIARAGGLKGRIANCLHYLGEVADREGNEGTARALYAESLGMFQRLGKKLRIALSLEAWARLAARAEPERAARLWGAAGVLREALGDPLPPNEREEYERDVAAVRNLLGQEQFARAWAAGQRLTLDEAILCALETGEESAPLSEGRPDAAAPSLSVPPLPVPPTPFFGRENEIAEIRARLAGGCRLLTLTGLGGTGKTRLALEVARAIQAAGELGGVGFVPLVDLADPHLLSRTIQGALELPTTDASDPLEEIAASLGYRPFLLVLDNFEQLLGEGTETVRVLLERSPGMRCLVTSRIPLGLPAELEYPVAPLPAPAAMVPLERLLQYPSVRLFQSRAQAVRPEFQVRAVNAAAVAQLCQALEGIPLALELAAGRAGVTTPAQMVELLSDRFGFLAGRQRAVAERHRTLRDVLDWSVQSLPEPQQRLLARLSVFRGGWTVEAAAAEGGSEIQETLDALAELREASLVISEEAGEAMRFRMLETVREYAAERLAMLGEADQAQTRHRDFFLALAEEAEPHLAGSEQRVWLDRLEAEHDNLRAALGYCQEAELELRLVGALWRFWWVRGHWRAARTSLSEALGREGGLGPGGERTRARAKALCGAGVLAYHQGDYRLAASQYEEALAIYREVEDKGGIASVLNGLGMVAQEQGDYGAAQSSHRESLALQRELDDQQAIAASISHLGNLAVTLGDHAAARAHFEESLAIRKELGDKRGIALSLSKLGFVAKEQGRYEQARTLYEQSLALYGELGDTSSMALARHFLGVVAEQAGDLALAREIYGECLTTFRELGDQSQVAWTLHGLGFLAYRQGDFSEARSLLGESLMVFRGMEHTIGVIRTLERLGGLAVAQGQMHRAARLLVAAESLRAAMGAPAAVAEQQEFEQDVASVRSALEKEAFAAAWAEGEAMTLAQASEYALASEAVTSMPADQATMRPAMPARGRVPATPLLATKLAIPLPAPMLIPRPRLTDRLMDAGGRLVLVVAQAGSGKSSLVSQWCQEHASGRVAWLSLDTHDNEPTCFLRYLCAALERVAPDAVRPVGALLESSGPPAPDAALTLLLNGLATLEQPVTLVLDDYHTIEAPAVHQLMVSLLEHRPPTLCLILASRSDPLLSLARLRARSELVELRAGDVRFTIEEASRFLNERMRLALAPEAVTRLTERTEGWITALQLAALSLQGHPEPEQFVEAFGGSHRYVVDYLVEEVLGRQPLEVRSFLRQTAILERLCGPLCEAVTGTAGGQAMLERLEAANLFLIPLDEQRRWYRYHHLFGEVLRTRPEPLLAAEAAALHGRAAAWFEAEGLIAEAMEHALAGADWERAAGLIEREWERMFRYDEIRTLERWLEALPTNLVRRRPQLSLALAVVRLFELRFAEAERILDEGCIEPMDDTAESRDFRGTLLSLRGFIARQQGDEDQAAVRWRHALECLHPDNLTWRSPALLELGILYAERADLDQAAAILAEARAVGARADYPAILMRASHAYSVVRESQGALREAGRVYEAALQYARERRAAHAPAAALIFAGLGRLCYEWNDLPGALAYLKEARERARSELTGAAPYAFDGTFEMLRVQTALGDAAAVEALFDQLAAGARGAATPLFEPAVAALRVQRAGAPAAEVAAWLERFEGRRQSKTLPSLPISGYCPPDLEGFETVIWARLRLAQGQGQAEAVVARLERVMERMIEQGRHGSALPVRALLATVYWEAGRPDQAVAVMEPALSLAAREGYVRGFLEGGDALAPVLRACADRGIAPETVSKLLAALESSPPVPVPLSPHPAPPLALASSLAPAGAGRERPKVGLMELVEPLTDRELEVLGLAADGLSNEAIAARLFLSVGTVKRHLHNTYGKLGVTGRFNAVVRVRELGLL